MDGSELTLSLNEIPTLWTVLRRAHDGAADAPAAQEFFCRRYHKAITRYLRRLVGDAADDEAQKFFVAFLGGVFRHADPDVGSFRHYVMKALRHQAAKYWQARQRGATAPLELVQAEVPDAAAAERELLQADRAAVIALAFAALRARKPDFHAALRMRTDHEDLAVLQLAAMFSRELGKEVSAAAFRQTLHRAREMFAELVVEQVAATLTDPSARAVEEELAALGLLGRCRDAVDRYHAARRG